MGGPLGEKSIKFGVPEGLLLDEAGNSIRQVRAGSAVRGCVARRLRAGRRQCPHARQPVTLLATATLGERWVTNAGNCTAKHRIPQQRSFPPSNHLINFVVRQVQSPLV